MDLNQLAILLGIGVVKGLALIALWFTSCFLFVKVLLVRLRRHRRKLAATQLASLDTISGEQFEEYLEVVFIRLGYEVDTTERYDKGADLIVTREGVRTAIQAKHRRDAARIGVEAVRTVVAALRPYRCTRGLVVTTGYFTQEAKNTARDNNNELWDRDALTDQILALAAPGQPLPTPPILAWLFEAPRPVPSHPATAHHDHRPRRHARRRLHLRHLRPPGQSPRPLVLPHPAPPLRRPRLLLRPSARRRHPLCGYPPPPHQPPHPHPRHPRRRRLNRHIAPFAPRLPSR